MEPTDGFAPRLHNSVDLNAALTGLLLLKFGSLVGPSADLLQLEADQGIDPWFELMKRYQQYPAEDMPELPGTNLLDWSRSQDVALYFANEERTGAGAIFVCDATATGKTLQVIPVAEILSKLRNRVLDRLPQGAPLLFSPKRQIGYERAKNQQAAYFADGSPYRLVGAMAAPRANPARIDDSGEADSTRGLRIGLPSLPCG